MKNHLNYTNLQNQVNKLDKNLKSNGENVVGIYDIKIQEWNAEDVISIIALTDKGIYLNIGEDIIDILFQDIDSTILQEDQSVKLQKKDDIAIEFEFRAGKKHNKNFVDIIQNKVNTKDIDTIYLPDLRNPGFLDQNSLYLMITSLILIVIGLSIQRYVFTWAWFLMVSGIFVMFVAIIITIIKKKLF